MSDFKATKPVFQAKLRSSDCLNPDIEWTHEYFASLRKAFDANPGGSNSNSSREEFYFDHPQADRSMSGFQDALLYDTFQDGAITSSLAVGGSDLLELQNLLDSGINESQGGGGPAILGANEPCFEIWLR